MNLIPLDKSWTIRHGVLDLLQGHAPRTLTILESESVLSDDLTALARALTAWPQDQPIDIGESATLYRFLRFAAWWQQREGVFIKRGSLLTRHIHATSEIIHWPLAQLLTLDEGTSQWASAALLVRGLEALPENPPHKLALTAEALKSRESDGAWQPRKDSTIARQLAALPRLLAGAHEFTPLHSEDYALARAFDLISAEEGERRWPQLRTHESDRIRAMEEGLAALPLISSRDHRVVQALAARGRAAGERVYVLYPQAVNKAWPQFWDALAAAEAAATLAFKSDSGGSALIP